MFTCSVYFNGIFLNNEFSFVESDSRINYFILDDDIKLFKKRNGKTYMLVFLQDCILN